MKWYFRVAGGHTHVRVFMNGGKCGDLCFRNEEFKHLMLITPLKLVEFINETEASESGFTR